MYISRCNQRLILWLRRPIIHWLTSTDTQFCCPLRASALYSYNIRNQTQSSTMSAATEFANPAIVESQQQQVADAVENVRDQLDDTPEHPVPVTKVVQWFIDVITSIITLIELIAMSYARRIMDIESIIRDNPPSTRATASSSIPSAPASRLKRCTKCHARGHDESTCRTADPSAMRKRVAANSRRAREARTQRQPVPPTYTAYPPSFPPSLLQPSLPLPSQASYSAIIADATEFRRRNAQSSRDRRRSRTTTTSNTT